jgi:hypothetical protein
MVNHGSNQKQEKPVFHVTGWVIIEEGKEKVITYIGGQGWYLEIKGQPAALRHGDRVVVKVYRDKAE